MVQGSSVTTSVQPSAATRPTPPRPLAERRTSACAVGSPVGLALVVAAAEDLAGRADHDRADRHVAARQRRARPRRGRAASTRRTGRQPGHAWVSVGSRAPRRSRRPRRRRPARPSAATSSSHISRSSSGDVPRSASTSKSPPAGRRDRLVVVRVARRSVEAPGVRGWPRRPPRRRRTPGGPRRRRRGPRAHQASSRSSSSRTGSSSSIRSRSRPPARRGRRRCRGRRRGPTTCRPSRASTAVK